MISRNWVEISRGALRQNLHYVRSRLPAATAVCAVVKADAYGHGAAECARVFAAAGVEWFAATSVEEAVKLRQTGLHGRILVLGGFAAAEAAAMVEHQLTPAIWDVQQIRWLSAALGSSTLAVHLKLETGMGRLGVTVAQAPAIASALAAVPGLRVEAVFSHLANAEAIEATASERQHQQLLDLAAGRTWHLLNSEGALRFAGWGGMLARAGLALYGYSAQPGHTLRPALSWKAHVIAVKDLPAGQAIGYGGCFVTPRPMRVATIAVGYADGYRRDFSPGASVVLGGQPAPVLGAISMDLTTVDASLAPHAALGDEAMLLGHPAADAAALAAHAHTIPYEVLCGISARVARLYVD